jgi:hypothetical protein
MPQLSFFMELNDEILDLKERSDMAQIQVKEPINIILELIFLL